MLRRNSTALNAMIELMTDRDWTSTPELVQLTGRTRQNIQSICKRLVDYGLMETKLMQVNNFGSPSTHYKLTDKAN